MSVFVFAGPTIDAGAIRCSLPDSVVLPPAAQGDVYTAARQRPAAIAVIDGYFERVPAVWHKEILWALSHGIHVFGSSSMGALRAAELSYFGMVGVGTIFEAYANGELEDDDEVAVVHGPGPAYRVASDALVNIRATLRHAVVHAVISPSSHDKLITCAKSMFYPERTYKRLLEHACQVTVSPAEVDRLRAWLPEHHIDQKRLDAVALLAKLQQFQGGEQAAKCVEFEFQHTDAWEQVRRQIDARFVGASAAGDANISSDEVPYDALHDEARLNPVQYLALRQQLLVRVLALEIGRTDGTEGEWQLTQTVEELRRMHGLNEPEQIQQWLSDNGLTVSDFTRLVEDEARVRRVRSLYESEIERLLADQLRLAGTYGSLSKRARSKHSALVSVGLDNPTLAQAHVDEQELWAWYFKEWSQQEPPDDMLACARSLGFPSVEGFRRMVLREYCYRRMETEQEKK